MSTLALNKLLEYILSLSLTNNNKDWLAGKIIESKAHVEDTSERDERLYSMFGAWKDDEDMDCFEQAIREGRKTDKTYFSISHNHNALAKEICEFCGEAVVVNG